jgi:hypothetical protein
LISKTVDNEIWSQQNLFSVDEESKVIGVEGDYKESSDKNVICPLVTSYFEKIDFPEDTLKYLDNLYEQIKPKPPNHSNKVNFKSLSSKEVFYDGKKIY